MPTFQYEAMNQAGQEVKEEIDAATTEDALAKIRTLGYFPTAADPEAGSPDLHVLQGRVHAHGRTLDGA